MEGDIYGRGHLWENSFMGGLISEKTYLQEKPSIEEVIYGSSTDLCKKHYLWEDSIIERRIYRGYTCEMTHLWMTSSMDDLICR